MRYILSSDYRFKGWHEAPTGLYNSRTRMTAFLPKDKYLLLLKCDGVHEIEETALAEEDRDCLNSMEKKNVIRKAMFWEKGYDERIRKAAEEPFREYLRRNPPRENRDMNPEEPLEECP